jgi:hypothetical protein
MIQDGLLEFNPQWQAIANPGIGGPNPYVAPKVFTATPATPAKPYLAVTIEGSSYTDCMAATHRPLMPAFFPDAVYYSYEFEITPDSNNASVQAFEFEASYCDDNSFYYNNSMQLNYVNPAGMIQAYASPTNVWANTGIVVPQFKPNLATPVKVDYLVDTVGHTMSTLAVEIGGVVHPLPAQFQKIPGAIRQGWASGVYVQFQLDLASKGGSMTVKYSDIGVDWL